jgi:hypothetical protein
MTTDAKGMHIELGDIATYQCPCCGQQSETVHGYLYDDTGETIVYFAGYTRGHLTRTANLVLSVGGWGEGMGPEDRHAVPLVITQPGHSLIFVDAEVSPWYGETFLGEMRDHKTYSDDERETYLNLAKAAIALDSRVADYLSHG